MAPTALLQSKVPGAMPGGPTKGKGADNHPPLNPLLLIWGD